MNYLLRILLENQQLNTKYVKSLFDKEQEKNYATETASYAEYYAAAKNVIDEINHGTGNCILPKNVDRFRSILMYLALVNIDTGYDLIFAEPTDSNGFAKNFHDAAIAAPDAKQFVVNFIDKFKLDSPNTTPENAIAFCKSAIQAYRAKTAKKSESEIIWTRVKLIETGIKYPGNEYVWVQALDKYGKPTGFIPTSVSNPYMHHCGNEPSVQNDDVYWGLRRRDDITKEVLTVILCDGNIAEAKSFGNQQNKFGSQIYKYVEALYASNYVKGLDKRYDYGYSVTTNFSVSFISSFDPKFLSWCKANKPEIIGNTENAILQLKEKYQNKAEFVKEYLQNPNNSKFTVNHWTVFLAVIGGASEVKHYLTEDDIINVLIKPNKLRMQVYANADLDLLTDRIQRAYCKYQNGSWDILLNIMQTVARFRIDPNIIEYLTNKGIIYTAYLKSVLPEHKLKYYGNAFLNV